MLLKPYLESGSGIQVEVMVVVFELVLERVTAQLWTRESLSELQSV